MTSATPHPNDTFNAEAAREIRQRDVFDDRNIRDEYKGLPTEKIHSMRKKNHLVAILSNTIRDFNFGSVVRSACCLGVEEVVFTGSRKYDKRGTVGAHKYMDISYIHGQIDAIEHYRNKGYTVIAAEYDEDYEMHSLYDYTWDENTAVIFGEEGVSLPAEVLDCVDAIVCIPMPGGIPRSLNLGVSSGIFFSHYASQHPISK